MAKTRPCEVCMQPIDADRLDAVPETRLCTAHAKQVQQYGGEFLVTATQERTSKAGSLKHNYGSVTTTKTRNTAAVDRLREAYRREQEA